MGPSKPFRGPAMVKEGLQGLQLLLNIELSYSDFYQIREPQTMEKYNC